MTVKIVILLTRIKIRIKGEKTLKSILLKDIINRNYFFN